MNLWKSPLFKISTIVVVILIETCNIACFVINKDNFRQYISYFLICQPGILSVITTMSFNNKFYQFLEPSTKDFWPIHAAGKKVEEKILHQSNLINKFVTATILILLGGYFLTYLPLTGDEENINPLEMVLKQYFGRWSLMVSLVTYAYCPIFAIGLVYPFLLVVYLVALASFQLDLLKEQLRTIPKEWGKVKGNDLLYNEEYQTAVHQRLVLCIKHHVRLIRFRNTWVKHSRFAMLYIPLASLSPVGAGYFLIHQISPSSNFRMVFILVLFAISATALCFIGQHFEDSFAEVFSVSCGCTWIYWNKKNRTTLLILLIRATRPVDISSYTTIALNLRLLLTFHKCIYSLMTLIR